MYYVGHFSEVIRDLGYLGLLGAAFVGGEEAQTLDRGFVAGQSLVMKQELGIACFHYDG